eukprot:Clim_evm35s210 gene=Clim_evmTU35s210
MVAETEIERKQLQAQKATWQEAEERSNIAIRRGLKVGGSTAAVLVGLNFVGNAVWPWYRKVNFRAKTFFISSFSCAMVVFAADNSLVEHKFRTKTVARAEI